MKLLYNTVTNSLHKYPRLDDEPVVGLSVDFEAYDLQILADPTYNPDTQYLESYETIDHDNKVVTRGKAVKDYQPVETEPDYNGFYSGLLGSGVYQQTIVPTLRAGSSLQLTSFMTVFRFAIEDAMNGRIQPNQPESPNSFQSALWLLMESAQGIVSMNDVQELQALMDDYNLSRTYVIFPPGS